MFTRERGPLESTDFSISRFLVPWLSGYEGVSIFMDCDMLCLDDIVPLVDVDTAVSVVQHDYTPKDATKFLGQPQTAYPRKNWSSLMVFDNARCTALMPEYVNTASGLDLHRFVWLDDGRIGALDPAWNHLVGEYPHRGDAKLVHYTNGGPWFKATENCDYAAEWRAELQHMLDAG